MPYYAFMKKTEQYSTVHTLLMYCLKMAVTGGIFYLLIHLVQGGVPDY